MSYTMRSREIITKFSSFINCL